MADDPQDIHSLIEKIEAEKHELEVTLGVLRRQAGLDPSESSGTGGAGHIVTPHAHNRAPSAPGRMRNDEFFRMSIPDAIKKFLSIMKSPQQPKAIADGLRAGGMLTNAKHWSANVWTAIRRLQAAEAIVNTPTGYGLTEWYPNRSAATKDTKKKRGTKKKGRGPGKEKAAPKSEPKSAGRLSYQAFVGKMMKEGKTMRDAAAGWEQYKAAHPK